MVRPVSVQANKQRFTCTFEELQAGVIILTLPSCGRGCPAGRRVVWKPQLEGPGELSLHLQSVCVKVDLGASAKIKQVITQDWLKGTEGITMKPRQTGRYKSKCYPLGFYITVENRDIKVFAVGIQHYH